MKTIKIKLDPSARHFEAYGREKHADVHFRISIEPYVRALNDYSWEARKAEQEAVRSFDDEVVDMLKADGTRRVHIGTAVRYVFEHTSYVKATTKKKVRQAA